MKIEAAGQISEMARWMIVVSATVYIDTGYNESAMQKIAEVYTFESEVERDAVIAKLSADRVDFKLFEVSELKVHTTIQVTKAPVKR